MPKLVWKPTVKKPVQTVRLRDGRTIDAVPGEPFYVEKEDQAAVTAKLQGISGTVSNSKAGR